MKTIKNPQKDTWVELCKRPAIQIQSLEKTVNEVFENIRENGDASLLKYTYEFDKVNIKSLKVSNEILKGSVSFITEDLKAAIDIAIRNVEVFHRSQVEHISEVETVPGVTCWRESRAIEKVGIYIPGGTAPLFSSVIMLAVPALIAGCKDVVLCSPPGKSGEIDATILYTAYKIGVKNIFRVGGIQAIGAMTFGTESIPRVEKIFGPGNQYVTAAKQMAQRYGIAIDMPAGPSEVLIIADKTANPAFIAADLLSQAEHGEDSQVMLLSVDEELIEKTKAEVLSQINVLPRKELALKAIENSSVVLLDNLYDCIDFSNYYAPEHLIIATENARNLSQMIISAGSVFLGNYSCESAGDYASGTNHTLPTNGYARNYSGVSLDSFLKKITFQEITAQGIKNIGPSIEIMAEAEQLDAHKNAVTIRLNYLSNEKQ